VTVCTVVYTQYARQSGAVFLVVFGSAHSSVHAVCAAVCGSKKV
jgi:hypothetical protein